MLEKILDKAKFIDVLIILLGSFALVSFWRGTWGLLDYYLIPSNNKLSYVVSIALSLIILTLMSRYQQKKRGNKNEK